MVRFLVLFLTSLIVISLWSPVVFASPESSNYQLQQYSFGSGGSTTDTSSPNNKLFGNTGELEFDPTGPNYNFQGGISYDLQSPTPSTPTVSNLHTNYDRLLVTLNPGTDPSSTKYLIAISPDSFTTTYYVTATLTLSSSYSTSYYQTYSAWGGSSGSVVTGLSENTTYSVKIKEQNGDFTESDWSAVATGSTSVPSLTFSVSGSTDMGNWNDANNYTSTGTTTLTTSTNAYNGYDIYGFKTAALTRTTGTETIGDFSGTYASPKSWSTGTGFGYTTNDTDIGGSSKWNATPCPGDGGSPLCYAAFSSTGPGDIVADHESNLSGSNPISNEQFTVTYKVSTTASQVAGVYQTTIVYTVVPTY